MEQPKEYYAFISYKREDEKCAKWLQEKLEHYKFPTNLNGRTDLPKKIYPTFRDITDLSPGLLAEEINNALRNSKWLIVICSPRSAKSPWVCKEAQTFIDLGRADHIIPFVIEGNPFSKDAASECYPEALLKLTGNQELLAANINEMGRDAAAIKVVARMFGIRFDILWQRHEKEKRKHRRRVLAAALAVAIIAIGVAGWLWTLNTQLANRNRQLSIENIKVSSREVINLLGHGNYMEALRELSSLTNLWKADYRQEAPEFEQALRTMFRYEQTDGIIKVFSIPFSNSQRYLASDSSYIYICDSKDWQDEIQLYDIENGEYKGKVFPTSTLRDSAMVKEIRDQKVLYCTSHKYDQDAPLRLYDLKSGKDFLLIEHCKVAHFISDNCILAYHPIQYINQQQVSELITVSDDHVIKRDTLPLPFFPEKAALAGDSLIIATKSMVATWHTKNKCWINQMTYRADDITSYVPQNVLAVSPASRWMANLRDGYGLVLFSTDNRDSLVINSKIAVASVAFNPQGTMMAVADAYADSLVVYATDKMIPLFHLSSSNFYEARIEFISNNNIIATNYGSMLSMFKVEANFDTCFLFSQDGLYRLKENDQRNAIEIVNDSTDECIYKITTRDDIYNIIGFSPHDHYLLISTSEYQYALLDFNVPKTIPIIPSSDNKATSWYLADCFSDDESTIAFLQNGDDNKSRTLKIYDVEKGILRDVDAGMMALDIDLNYDGSQLAMTDGNTIKLLQIDSQSVKPNQDSSTTHAFSIPNLSIADMCFTPNGRDLMVSYSDGSLRQWNIESKQASSPTMRSDDDISFRQINISPDGQYVMASAKLKSDKWIHRIWHIVTGHQVDCLTNEWSWFLKPYIPNFTNPYYKACFSSEGSRLIINEHLFMGLSRTFRFPSFDDLIEMYSNH